MAGDRGAKVSAHVHWWLAALSFALGMVLTFTLSRPAKAEMPAWVSAGPSPQQAAEPAPSVAEVSLAEAPTQQMPVVTTGPPAKKAVAKAPPKRRRPPAAGDARLRAGSGEAVTERIKMIRDAPTERIPISEDAATQRIPVVKKPPAKRAPAKKGVPAKARPKGPRGTATKRVPGAKGTATKKISVGDDAPTTVLPPLMPYAPYGPGSMRANPDGSGPEDWPVKGRTDSRLFYTPEDPDYDSIEAQVWFENEEFAKRAFFTPWSRSTRKN